MTGPLWRVDREEEANVETAMLRLRQIWFQQSFTSGWSGSVKAPIGGLGGEASASSELAERQMTFPDVVTLFRDFLRQISVSREVRIGIDELDKMGDEGARRFLNEIKVVFRIPNCFFFISVSEDAMSAFERRGLPFREVFDSSFDDVVKVDHLDFASSEELLNRRIVGLPAPFAALAHCLSGGLPRDLIRNTRELIELPPRTTLHAAAARLTYESMRSKLRGIRIAARHFESEEHAAILARLRRSLADAGADREKLLAVCSGLEDGFLRGDHSSRRRRGIAGRATTFAVLRAAADEFRLRDGDDPAALRALLRSGVRRGRSR